MRSAWIKRTNSWLPVARLQVGGDLARSRSPAPRTAWWCHGGHSRNCGARPAQAALATAAPRNRASPGHRRVADLQLRRQQSQRPVRHAEFLRRSQQGRGDRVVIDLRRRSERGAYCSPAKPEESYRDRQSITVGRETPTRSQSPSSTSRPRPTARAGPDPLASTTPASTPSALLDHQHAAPTALQVEQPSPFLVHRHT